MVDGASNIPHDKLLTNPSAVSSVRFLVAVNQTEVNCVATSSSPPLQPGKVHNKTEYIHVGKCDYGALDFNITSAGQFACTCTSTCTTFLSFRRWKWSYSGLGVLFTRH